MDLSKLSDEDLQRALKQQQQAPLTKALKDENVANDDPVAYLARSIFRQESSSGKDTRTSNRGAVGPMQMIPSTFHNNADEGWDINNPYHNSRAAIREIQRLSAANDGDPTLIAAGYYGGQAASTKAARHQAVSDPKNPSAPNTLQYAQQVTRRLPQMSKQTNLSTLSDDELMAMQREANIANQGPIGERYPERPTNNATLGTRIGNVMRGAGSETFNTLGNVANFALPGNIGDLLKQYADTPANLANMPGSSIGRFITDMIPQMVAGKAGDLVTNGSTLIKSLLRAGASGAVGGLTANEGDRLKDTLYSTAGSLGGDVLGSIVNKLITPAFKVHPDAQALIDRGITLTPGQMSGPVSPDHSVLQNIAKTVEDQMTSVPFVGGQVTARRVESLNDFNRSEINKALSTIPKAKIPVTVAAGFNSIDHAHDIVSKHYDDALKNVDIYLEQPHFDDIIKTDAASALPAPYLKRFNSTVNSILHPIKTAIEQNKVIHGPIFKGVLSNFNTKIRKFNNTLDPLDDDIATQLFKVKSQLNESLSNKDVFQKAFSEDAFTSDPKYMLNMLQQADTAFARLIPIDKAATFSGSPTGVFTPHSLYNAIKQTTGNAQTFARGTAYNQIAAAQARNILPATVPDSGTAGRALLANLMAGFGLGSATGIGGIPGLVSGAGLTALGTPWAQKAIVKPYLFGGLKDGKYSPSIKRTDIGTLMHNLIRASAATATTDAK
jgi:hypothetical protein